MACSPMMVRHTTFRYCLDPTVEQSGVLDRHAGAARFAFNQCLGLVKTALDHRATHPEHRVPWTRFDLINAFNTWKKTEAAGRCFIVDSAGVARVQVTGLAWRAQVCQAIRVGDHNHPRSVTLPGIGTINIGEDTRRLRQMLAKARARILHATIAYRAGRWWVGLTTEAADLHPTHQHLPRAHGDAGGWVGVDRGLSAFVVAADTEGTQVARVDAPKPLVSGLGRQRRLARSVNRKQRGSAHHRRAVARLARHHRRVGNIRRHFHHQVADQLVKTRDRLVIEDLNVAGMLAN
ncbi:RNA-guided endonuclease InsQ/TnpB family protein [Nocardia mangyaensis]|uniref:RNA-guided endonuclease InsQ/TnpB family protein n=1 Tax=Nocardia mangyaensis TaxID=2213200 RepID=UPI002676168B|nr:transposase [Nocardia mangyaensis]MDO3651272.1 transposase [Nocardia mangyaensis]